MIDKGELTQQEWKELETLDYVLTWRYSDNEEKGLKRQKELVALDYVFTCRYSDNEERASQKTME